MAKRKAKGHKLHKFRNKLLLNQWLISLLLQFKNSRLDLALQCNVA